MYRYLRLALLGFAHRVSPVMLALLVALLLVPLFGDGCAPTMTHGKDFSGKSVTEQVRIGETKMETLLAILGEPKGRGKAILAPQLIFKPGQAPSKSEPAGVVDVWDYYFAVGEKSGFKQKILFLFFDKERVAQGYIWFSDF